MKGSERQVIDTRLEHKESMRSVVGVERLTIGAKVPGAAGERTTVPLSDDLPTVFVADDVGMSEATKIGSGV